MTDSRVVVLVGSVRADSLNRRVAHAVREHAPAGVIVDVVDDLGSLPFYDPALDPAPESVAPGAPGAPGAAPAYAVRLRERVAAADVVLAITPEHNGSTPAPLANALDWLSRPYGAGALVGKPFGVVGTTPTPYGGKWAHEHLQRSAGIAGAHVLDDAIVSQSAIGVDVVDDPEVRARFWGVVETLLAAERVAA